MESAIPEEQEQQEPGVEEELFRELCWEAGNVVLWLSGTEDAAGAGVFPAGAACVQRGVDTSTEAELCIP